MSDQRFPFVLASNSHQRRTLVKQMGIRFSMMGVDVDESVADAQVKDHRDIAKEIALRKLHKVQSMLPKASKNSHIILTADTLVSLHKNLYGKPNSASKATEYLNNLNSTTHEVITAMSLSIPQAAAKSWSDFTESKDFSKSHFLSEKEDFLLEEGSNPCLITSCSTKVRFSHNSEEVIAKYVHSGEWQGAAGAYRIQDKGSCLVSSINGSYPNVVGLPIHQLYGILTAIDFWR
jgi:septum formation protein